jgi:hypothetical protein
MSLGRYAAAMTGASVVCCRYWGQSRVDHANLGFGLHICNCHSLWFILAVGVHWIRSAR